jgi:hypothetical protein
MLTNEQIQEARKLCNEATEGPWETDARFPLNVYCDDSTGSIIASCEHTRALRENLNFKNNAQFIAASRTLLPAALDEIERLQKSIDALWLVVVEKSTCTSVRCNWDCGSTECKKAFMEHYLSEETKREK